jgi:trehalose monomycolate/heme transporter
MLSWLGGAIYRARWAVLVGALAVIVAAALYGVGLFSVLKSGGFTDPASESSRAQTLIDTRFSKSTSDVIILMRSDALNATDPAFADAATQLLGTLQARPEVGSVASYYSTHSPGFISRDGHETFAALHLVAPDETTKEQDYQAIEPLITSPSLQITVGGNVPINVAFNKQIGADIEHAEMVTLPIVAVLLVIVFGGLVAAGLPLMIGVVAILGAFALLRVLAAFTDISVFTQQIVTGIGLGLAIDYALFITTRFREELAPDERDVRGALRRTMATAGRTVLFSALTVSMSLLGLLLFPEFFLRSMGLAASMAVLAAMVAALTLLPAVLALLGRRVNALSVSRAIAGIFRRGRAQPTSRADAHGAWYQLSQAVMRWPVPVALAVVVILLLLGSPFVRASFATSGVDALPVGQPARVATERLASDFAQQGGSQLVIAVRTPGDALTAANLASLDSYVRQIEALPGVVHVDSLVTADPSLSLDQYQQLYANPGASPQLAAVAAQLANGDITEVSVALQPAEQSAKAQQLVRQTRALQVPGGLQPLVGGFTPYQMDLFASLQSTLPWAGLVIVLAMLVLLFLMTGSVVMPLKAVVLNTLSLTATFGALVWIFQEGHFEHLLGFQSTGSLDATQPVLIFAIAFGLSMDYEVFLLSRIKEQFDATGDNRAAVASGLQRTGWLITSAALLLAVVLGAFATSAIVFIKMIGVGIAIAVIMDATLVRALLVPATMRLLGKWNWWAPAPLRALWRRIGLGETSAHVTPVAEAAAELRSPAGTGSPSQP